MTATEESIMITDSSHSKYRCAQNDGESVVRHSEGAIATEESITCHAELVSASNQFMKDEKTLRETGHFSLNQKISEKAVNQVQGDMLFLSLRGTNKNKYRCK